jgi:4-amino-4-deoxy-L-arabinose transferase-like glycosyltransferase
MTRPRGISPRPWAWAAVALITLAAAALRLIGIGQVQTDPFYDAAVRSMGLSWHNFFFGAFDPGGTTSIDKPPVDLWLQVASVKLLGFSTTTVKLPEALAGIVSVPLLFGAVRRMWSTAAGLAAAAALAIMPIEVITSRSDTMDAVMMALIVLALWLIVRACETGRWAWLLAGAACMGLAFEVKLMESLVALPGLALLAYLGMPGPRRRRVLQTLAAGTVFVAVALAWLSATLLFPGHQRPWAIGSTNGSAWNAAFVFNGTDRLGSKAPEPGGTSYEAGHSYPTATQAERDHIPIVPPSPTRLLSTIGPLSGGRLGLELLIGLLLGVPALIGGVLADRRAAAPGRPPEWAAVAPAPVAGAGGPESPGPRMRLAVAGGLLLWTATGVVLFSHMIRLHPRYVESFVPAVAALLGIGAAWAGAVTADVRASRARLVALTVALVVTVYYVQRLQYGFTTVWWIAFAAACAALAMAVLARRWPGRGGPLAGATIALTLVAVLALPLRLDVAAIHDKVDDAGHVGALSHEELTLVSAYTRAHRHGARYELAAASATEIGALIVKDVEPVLILTTYDGRVLTDVAELRRAIAAGEVKYAFLNETCDPSAPSAQTNAACSEPVRWIRAHGRDVSRAAGLSRGGLLYLLPGASG